MVLLIGQLTSDTFRPNFFPLLVSPLLFAICATFSTVVNLSLSLLSPPSQHFIFWDIFSFLCTLLHNILCSPWVGSGLIHNQSLRLRLRILWHRPMLLLLLVDACSKSSDQSFLFFFSFFLTTVNSPDVQCMLQIRPPRPRRPNLILPMLVRSGLQTPRSTLPRRLRPLRMLRSLRPPKTSRPCPNITH